MPRLPQAIIRQRTRQDLLRQRQQQLRQRIEQPQPTQPITTQEREEYERLNQEWEQQQSRLQESISNVEKEMAVNLATFQTIKEAIRQKEAANPEYTSGFDTRRANEYANRYEDLKIRLGHLKASGSIEEASLYGAYYKGARREELGRQTEQRRLKETIQIEDLPPRGIRGIGEEVVSSFKGAGGREIPVTRAYIYDSYTGQRRTLTPEEYQKYKRGVLIASEKKPSIVYKIKEKIPTELKTAYGKIVGAYGETEQFVSKYTTKPTFEYLEKHGVTKKEIAEVGLGRPEMQPSVFGLFSPEMQVTQRDIQRGVVTGVLEDVEERPIQNVLMWGTGRAVGYSVIGAERGLKALGVGQKAIGVTEKVVGVGAGSLFFVSAAAELREAETPGEVGEKLGVIGKDVALFGWGMKEPLRRGSIYRDLSRTAEKLPPEQQKIFWETYKEAQKLRGIKPEVRTLDLSRLEAIESKPRAQEYLKKYFEGRRDVIVGGSVSQQSQFELGIGGTKRPSDIDLYIKGGAESVLGKQYARDIAKGLRDVGVSAYAKNGKVSISGEKFIEFHSYKEFLKPNIEQVTPIYYPARMGLTKTPEGVKILRLGIQAPRKVIGFYLEPVQTGKVRLKDLPAYETIKESLLKTKAKAQKEPTWISYGEKEFEISVFGKEGKVFKPLKTIKKGEVLKPSVSYKKISDYYKIKVSATKFYYVPKRISKDVLYAPLGKSTLPLIPLYKPLEEKEPWTPPPPPRERDFTYTPTEDKEKIVLVRREEEKKGERIRPERGIRNIPTGWPEPKLFKIKSFGREGYDVGIIVNRKPVIIRRGLNIEDARDYGTERVLKDLRATFFIVKSKKKAKDIPNTGAFEKYRKLLRQPLPQSSYKKLGEEVYIQRRRKVDSLGGRLAFKGEVAEIMAAKRKAPSKKQKKKLFRWLK